MALDKTRTSTGTIIYQAPEVARAERYTFSADVFSFAITAYEIAKREKPFSRSERCVRRGGVL